MARFLSLWLARSMCPCSCVLDVAGVVRSVGDYASSLGETVKSTVQEKVCAHMHTHIHIHTYTYTHTHTHIKPSVALVVSLAQAQCCIVRPSSRLTVLAQCCRVRPSSRLTVLLNYPTINNISLPPPPPPPPQTFIGEFQKEQKRFEREQRRQKGKNDLGTSWSTSGPF